MKTYESIEVGNTLNALSDLTGDICEFYAQDINPPANLFYIMYKSYLNRSLVVCWRNQKRLTHTGFHHTLESIEVNMIHVVEVGFFLSFFFAASFLARFTYNEKQIEGRWPHVPRCQGYFVSSNIEIILC
jgi:hypothetical protein